MHFHALVLALTPKQKGAQCEVIKYEGLEGKGRVKGTWLAGDYGSRPTRMALWGSTASVLPPEVRRGSPEFTVCTILSVSETATDSLTDSCKGNSDFSLL